MRRGGGLDADATPLGWPAPAPLPVAYGVREGCTERYGGDAGPPSPGEGDGFDMFESARDDDDERDDAVDDSRDRGDRGYDGGCRLLI